MLFEVTFSFYSNGLQNQSTAAINLVDLTQIQEQLAQDFKLGF